MRSATLSGYRRADDWIRTSINRFTRPAPFSVEPRRPSTSARSRTPSASFGGWLLSQEHTRVKRPPDLAAWDDRISLLQFETFQYASLTNFDQLSIRTWWSGVHRLPRRTDRLPAAASCRPAAACGRPCACCSHARQHAVLPGRHATLRPRHDVVDRQFVACPAGRRNTGRRSGPA